MVTRTVLQLITDDWQVAGRRGRPSQGFIRQWRRDYPSYGLWPLWTKFGPDSLIPIRGESPTPELLALDRSTEPPQLTERRAKHEAELAAWLESAQQYRQSRQQEAKEEKRRPSLLASDSPLSAG